jgi:DNA polymerase (family 10)
MENREIARVLWETADLMEIAGEDSFRIRSYRNGATAIDGYPERVSDILRDSRHRKRAGRRAPGNCGSRFL